MHDSHILALLSSAWQSMKSGEGTEFPGTRVTGSIQENDVVMGTLPCSSVRVVSALNHRLRAISSATWEPIESENLCVSKG